MASHAKELPIEYERLRSVFQLAPLTLSVTVVNGLVVALVLTPVDGLWRLVSWAGAIIAVSAVRWIGGRTFLRGHVPARSCRGWAIFSVLGSLMTGVLWGIGATALFPASEWHQLFLSLVIGGMCAGAITVNAAHLPTTVAFILPASLPLAASFLARGPAWQMPALMVVIFAAALCAVGLAGHRTFGDRIRLQLALDREHRKLSEANQRLLQEAAQRRTVEATLQQAQKIEAIGHLTGGIAHDFNNLLQVIIGNTELIRQLGSDNPRVVRYAAVAEQAALRGAELTSSLLTFARRQTLVTEPVDLNSLLREFEPILLQTLGESIRLEIVLVPDLPRCLADPSHFQSAVLNLAINARDAMPEGGVLSVTTCVATLGTADMGGNQDASPGRFAGVSVRDTGCGISADAMARVFEPFFTTKEVGKGTGLGLSQVYGFARQSRGHIGLVSTPNEGTVATLWLPISSAAAEDAGGQAPNVAERSEATGRHSDPMPASG